MMKPGDCIPPQTLDEIYGSRGKLLYIIEVMSASDSPFLCLMPQNGGVDQASLTCENHFSHQ